MNRIPEELAKNHRSQTDRREFLKSAGRSMAVAAGMLAATKQGSHSTLARTREEKLRRIASNCWSVRHLFRQRPFRPSAQMSDEQRKRWAQYQLEREQWKKKYRELTLRSLRPERHLRSGSSARLLAREMISFPPLMPT